MLSTLSSLLTAPVTAGGGLPLFTDVLDLLLAFVLGMCLAKVYMASHRGLSYSRNLVHSLVLIPMIITMVMLIVSGHVARAFGLMGSLSIVRIRTVLRDPRDTAFIFTALGLGIAVGAQQHLIALVTTGAIAAVAYAMPATGFVSRPSDTGMLRVRGVESAGTAIEAVLAKWCQRHELVALRPAAEGVQAEFTYLVQLLKPSEQSELVKAMRAVNGATQVSIVIEEKGEEW